MPAYSRRHQLQNSLVYHVYNRGNARLAVFNEPDDYHLFITLLGAYVRRFGLKIYHWVLMTNHYHLLMELTDPYAISKIMAGLNRTYTYFHHKKYSSAGFLWQGRFKMQPVQKERYLIACGRYIERNPVKAGIAIEADQYLFSSAGFYCQGKADQITSIDPAYLEFGEDVIARRENYKEFLRNFDNEEERCFENLEEPAGSDEFRNKLVRVNGRLMPKKQGRPKEIIYS